MVKNTYIVLLLISLEYSALTYIPSNHDVRVSNKAAQPVLTEDGYDDGDELSAYNNKNMAKRLANIEEDSDFIYMYDEELADGESNNLDKDEMYNAGIYNEDSQNQVGTMNDDDHRRVFIMKDIEKTIKDKGRANKKAAKKELKKINNILNNAKKDMKIKGKPKDVDKLLKELKNKG